MSRSTRINHSHRGCLGSNELTGCSIMNVHLACQPRATVQETRAHVARNVSSNPSTQLPCYCQAQTHRQLAIRRMSRLTRETIRLPFRTQSRSSQPSGNKYVRRLELLDRNTQEEHTGPKGATPLGESRQAEFTANANPAGLRKSYCLPHHIFSSRMEAH